VIKFLTDENEFVLHYEQSGKLIGMLRGRIKGNSIIGRSLFVDPDYRGHKIASEIVDYVEDYFGMKLVPNRIARNPSAQGFASSRGMDMSRVWSEDEWKRWETSYDEWDWRKEARDAWDELEQKIDRTRDESRKPTMITARDILQKFREAFQVDVLRDEFRRTPKAALWTEDTEDDTIEASLEIIPDRVYQGIYANYYARKARQERKWYYKPSKRGDWEVLMGYLIRKAESDGLVGIGIDLERGNVEQDWLEVRV
jgi:GNAT superfamily N-acetyltransferase